MRRKLAALSVLSMLVGLATTSTAQSDNHATVKPETIAVVQRVLDPK